MPRHNTGPRLALRKKKGYTQGIFVIRWYEGGQKFERSTGSPDRGEAEAALEAFLTERHQSAPGPKSAPEMSIADVLAIYGDEVAAASADPGREGYTIDALLSFWGDRTVSAITGNTCRAYVKHRTKAQGKAISTARRDLAILNAAIRYSHREGHLLEARPVTLPSVPDSEKPWLTRPAAAAMLRAARRSETVNGVDDPKARHHLPMFLLLSLYHGARSGAVLALQWQPNTEGGYVDLENGFIDFNPISFFRSSKRKPRVRIAKGVRRFLEYQRQRTTKYVCEYVPDGADPDELPSQVKSIKRSFATACRIAEERETERAARLGIQPRFNFKGVSPHTLRHTAITWLMQSGTDIWEVAGFVSASPEMIMKVYGHHHPDHLKEAANADRGRKSAG